MGCLMGFTTEYTEYTENNPGYWIPKGVELKKERPAEIKRRQG
jgi:hypothetical protein